MKQRQQHFFNMQRAASPGRTSVAKTRAAKCTLVRCKIRKPAALHYTAVHTEDNDTVKIAI